MALARARRTNPDLTTGRDSSMRCRRWCSRSCSCCRCFWSCSSSCRRKSPARTRRSSSSTPSWRSSANCCRWKNSARSISTTSSRNCARGWRRRKASATASRASMRVSPARGAMPPGRASELNKALDSEKQVTARALAQIEVLNQQISALRRQLAALEEALDASEKRDKELQGRIADLGQRLNVALAQRVQELSRYRSEFFGRLRAFSATGPTSESSATASCSSRRCFSTPDRRAVARRPRRTRQARKRAGRARQADSGRDRLGAAGRRPYRRAADLQQPAVHVELGTCRRRARSRWCSIWFRSACRRSGWSRPALPNSSRSTPPPPMRPTGATAASS